MENNKYYVPSIEEFRVGFEFEMKDSSIEYGHDMWVKSVFGNLLIKSSGGQYSLNLKDYVEYIKDEDVRVKYLDREDIEELGYHLAEERDWRNPKGRGLVFKKSKDSGDERMGHTDWSEITFIDWINSPPNISIKKGRSGHESGVEGYESNPFSGIVKNKSELKVLMNQLGISNGK